MAKTITINDPTSGVIYTLEYNRKAVEVMEKQGFIASELQDKPMTHIPILFRGAFFMHHRYVKPDVLDGLYAKLTHKEELILALLDMYSEPIITLTGEPDDQAGNVDWTANK